MKLDTGFHESKLFAYSQNTTEVVIHGALGLTHCEEVVLISMKT